MINAQITNGRKHEKKKQLWKPRSGRIILKLGFEKYNVRACTGFNWLSIGSGE
jgi:hypothetical protein